MRREAPPNGDGGGQERKSVWVIGRAQWNIPPRIEPTCLSGGWHQPPPPGIPRRRMCNPAHHIECHAIATYSEGLPSEAATISPTLLALRQQPHTHPTVRLRTIPTPLMSPEVGGLQTVAFEGIKSVILAGFPVSFFNTKSCISHSGLLPSF